VNLKNKGEEQVGVFQKLLKREFVRRLKDEWEGKIVRFTWEPFF
jgi:hypothetical protein